jgi:integrase
MVKKIERKDGISYERKEKREIIPSKEQYKQVLQKLIEDNDITTLIAIRMGCEMGMTRIEICNAEVGNIDLLHKRGLVINVAKKVRRGNKYVMRKREIPVNVGLYSLIMSYVDKDKKYILKRERKSDIMKPFEPLHINYLYEKSEIPWSTHKSRHYFKNQIRDWMRKNRQMDEELVRHYMGHTHLDAHQSYGDFSWDYKLEVIDNVFE